MHRLPRHAVLFSFLVTVSLQAAHGRQLQLEAPSSTYNRSAYGCQRHAVYDDPWVKDNVAFTYAVIIRDGLGGQTTRIIAVYALAAAMGVGYVHSPLSCIGHIGGFPHWRNRTCDNVDPADKAKMQRISKFLMLPNTTKQDTSSWRQELFMKGSWEMLANVTETALRLQQPTVIRIEWVHNFLSDCPDLFFHVPSWRPSSTSVPQVPASSSWLLNAGRSKRVVVHMRRGDLTSLANRRTLPTSFYLQVIKQVTEVLTRLGLDYTVEWFTELGTTAADHEDLQRIRRDVPNLAVQINTDLLWNWHQMATADVFVMSKSAYSMVPAVVNPNAVIIRAPAAMPCAKQCTPSHWLITEDFEGSLSQEALYYVRRQLSGSGGPTAGGTPQLQ